MFVKFKSSMTHNGLEYYVNLDTICLIRVPDIENVLLPAQKLINIYFNDDKKPIVLEYSEETIDYITDIINKYNRLKFS